MNKAGKLNRKTVQLTELALLTALLMVLTIFNIGFINYGVISITILHIPVIIGSILMGPYYGGTLGLIFGVLSMLNATFRGVTPVDLMFSPFASGLPLQSIVMSVVPRVLLGVIPALLYRLLHKKIKNRPVVIGISAAVASLLHTAGVLGCLYFMFFPEMNAGTVFSAVIGAVVQINGILEIICAVVISSAVCSGVMSYMRNQYDW